MDTPDTVNYLILGMISLVALYGGYLGSIGLRFRNKQKEINVLDQFAD